MVYEGAERVSYLTHKVYRGGYERVSIKGGIRYSEKQIRQAVMSRQRRRDRKEREYCAIMNGQYSFFGDRQKLLEEWEYKYSPKLSSIKQSISRARSGLDDIMESNDFEYFVTLTFDKAVIDRLDDREVRGAFGRWRKAMKRTYPCMYYVAVEEYHKRGGLHYHLLVGGVGVEEMGLKDSDRRVRKGRTRGKVIYNITRWRNGFSTAIEIGETEGEQESTKRYVAKYLSKNGVDPRFYRKKRYFCSQNIKRPEVHKSQFPRGSEFDIFDSILIEDYDIEYVNPIKDYIVLGRDLATNLWATTKSPNAPTADTERNKTQDIEFDQTSTPPTELSLKRALNAQRLKQYKQEIQVQRQSTHKQRLSQKHNL